MVVTLFVALGIALVQGCEGPARGLGGGDGVVRHAKPHPPSAPDAGGTAAR
ncbi:hypothetical protein [Streptomyces sp. FL07-04A]|uniref:hypothetical protein n=1 Tax=Streptomyces sp. FL07-04A TaxID=3028658 RepID=UPI0029C05960|nr:hypothetical protein [Streptomyces sp. FL07-04A]